GPFGELNLRDELGSEPSIFFHRFGRKGLTPPRVFRFRKIRKRADFRLERFESFKHFLLSYRRKTVLYLGDENQSIPIVVSDGKIVESALPTGFIAANYQLLTAVHFVFQPGPARLSGFVCTAGSLRNNT